MSQNRSSAVMQQRAEPHDSLDDFPTPPWATRALMDYLMPSFGPFLDKSVREPASNRGHMVRPLREFFGRVEASDVHDYGAGFPVEDYLFGPPPARTDWTITNPPFRLAEQFIRRGLECSDHVAVIVRLAFLESMSRHRDLFAVHRPSLILQFTERVVMHKGKLVNPQVAVETWSEKEQAFVVRKPSSATAYCWVVWTKWSSGTFTSFDWIAPCSLRLTRPGDYEAAS
ncbi:MAG: hypothetical protein MUE52_04335 [Tabrizicola sp.]|jgi:hypothetical protein|nr:hypothetical protein [Tabrizicola sp.]